jgi:hypothetical protein
MTHARRQNGKHKEGRMNTQKKNQVFELKASAKIHRKKNDNEES